MVKADPADPHAEPAGWIYTSKAIMDSGWSDAPAGGWPKREPPDPSLPRQVQLEAWLGRCQG